MKWKHVFVEKSETAKIVIVYMKIECHCRQVSDSHTYKRTTQYIFVGEYNCVKVCMKVCEYVCFDEYMCANQTTCIGM